MATETRSAPSLDLEALSKLEFPIVQYEVGREKIAEYVAALDDRNPLYRKPAAAREAGYRDVIAPPTFAALFASKPFRRALADQEWVDRSTIDPSRILHGEQTYEFERPVMPGDRLLVQSIVSDVVDKERVVLLLVATRVDNEHGERVLDAKMTLVLRKGSRASAYPSCSAGSTSRRWSATRARRATSTRSTTTSSMRSPPGSTA